MATDRDDADFEPPHTSSPTDHVLSELQLYGYRPFQDEPDPRPLPQANAVSGAVADLFDALIATLCDTHLEPDLEELLWSTVNLFHRAADRVQRELDDNEDAQKRSQNEQDGSEIRSVELERLVAEGVTLIERRSSTELFRDLAADQFERHTGSSWRPRSGSLANHRTLHRRPRLQRSFRDLGDARQGPRQASGNGIAAWRQSQGRGAHRRLLG
jgi:hypothetical protein